ncbi:NAD-dependent epimerase/dehydratase family protein [uncultured Nocardioides sp.]|uniref:NAD-dependent epimerase/dehydratase family protein n=1 Tax=uncultured Nocardioides sp. TaxID=198441 RepID=UPI002619D995|nr:NAD-dependent epimerase/dehydratase family protein [uncultured Nocardioides sp.]
MRFLVLGGTVFLSRAVAVEAAARGHEVSVAARGASGSVPDGVRHVVLDRTEEIPADLATEEFDAVVDVARTPSWVRRAVTAWPRAHWTFVSTINVYADETTPGGTPASLPLVDAQPEDVDLRAHPEAYGPMKVACEQLVREGAERAFVVRPGLIVGPGDPTGRFTYWPARLADVGPGEPVLAGGDPSDTVQVIDVRDLAAWIVTAAEAGLTGDLDGVGPATALGDLLAEVAAGLGVEPRWTWASDAVLEVHDVAPWMGPRSLPLWLPRPAYDGMLAHDWSPSRNAGLTARPIAETARDTLEWLRATPDAVVTGLTREQEREVLDGLA